jgi:hypothetical protein
VEQFQNWWLKFVVFVAVNMVLAMDTDGTKKVPGDGKVKEHHLTLSYFFVPSSSLTGVNKVVFSFSLVPYECLVLVCTATFPIAQNETKLSRTAANRESFFNR